ncbi:MAG: PAS domain S-box protein [Acidobacteriota bacterium]
MMPAPPFQNEEALEYTSDGFAALDSEFRIVHVNSAAARLSGLSKECVLGRTPFEVFPEMAGTEFEHRLRRAIAERESAEFDYYLGSFDMWLEMRIFPSRCGGAVVWFRDATGRRRAEQALEESKQELKEAQRLTQVGSWLYDPETDNVSWSEELYRIVACDPSLPPPTFEAQRRIYTPESYELLKRAVERAVEAGEPYELDLEMITLDGVHRWVTCRGEAVRDASGRVTRLRGTTQDITARIDAEQKMSSLAAAIEQSAEQVVITDTEGKIVYCNPAFENVTGYTKEEVAGRNPRFLKSGRQGGEFYSKLWETIRRGEVWSGQFVNRRKDGTFYSEDATISPIRAASGKITGFVAVKRDVTERINLENQLRRAQKLESVGRLAGGVAHDFNNLLTVINGYAEMMLNMLGEGDPLRAPVAEIQHAGERAAALTRQLLTFSRAQVVEPKATDLNSLITENRAMFQRLLGEDIELLTKLASPLGPVMADPGQLHQVVMNLAVNARDAMPGGGKLTIETANVELEENEVAGLAPGPYVLLTVADTGVGIEKEIQERIFDPFFTTKGEGEGTGLGLSMVYGIVRQSGGAVALFSEPGQGATFRIYLPRTEGGAAGVEAAEPAAGGLRGSETILVVEDQDAVRKWVVQALKSYGYRILEASQGADALEMTRLHEGAIELLLTDVVMPHMTGKELAEQLQPLRPDMKVLYMSGYAADLIARRAPLDPGVAHIAKPFTPSALAAKVREVLGAGKPR